MNPVHSEIELKNSDFPHLSYDKTRMILSLRACLKSDMSFHLYFRVPPSRSLLFPPVAIRTRWIKGLRDRICLGEKLGISQNPISDMCINIP